MVCNKCGKENQEGTVFCINCGNKLDVQANTNNAEVTSQPEINTVNNVDINQNDSVNNIDTNTNNFDTNYQTSLNNIGNNLPNKPKRGFNKRILFIGIIVLVLIGVGLFFLLFKSSKQTNNLFNENNLIKIKNNGMYGYINSNGKIVIEPKYSSASDFYGKYALVRENIKSAYGESEAYEIIDAKGNVIVTPKSYYSVEYLANLDVWVIDDRLYNSELKPISEEGVEVDYGEEGYFSWNDRVKKQGGIMNASGKKTYTYNFKSGEDYIGIDVSENAPILKERYCRITVDNEKYAIVNCDTGKVIYDYTDKYISLEDDNIFEVSDKDSYKTLFSLYIQGDKILYQTENGNIELYGGHVDNGYISVHDNNKYEYIAYIDIKEGKVVSERPTNSSYEYSSLNEWEIKTGITEFECNYKYGLKKGDKILVECGWDDIDYLSLPLYEYLESKGKSYVLGEKDSKMYLINPKNGKVVAEFNSSSVYDSSSSTFLYYTDKDTKKKVIYNLATNKSLVLDDHDDYDIYSNYITVESGNKINYYNTDLKLIYTIEK